VESSGSRLLGALAGQRKVSAGASIDIDKLGAAKHGKAAQPCRVCVLPSMVTERPTAACQTDGDPSSLTGIRPEWALGPIFDTVRLASGHRRWQGCLGDLSTLQEVAFGQYLASECARYNRLHVVD
jgi:hypothetical protein